MQQIVQQMADEQGTVEIQQTEAVEPEIEHDINIRDEDLQLFESEDGRLFIKTNSMAEEVHAEVVPTSEGPIAEVVVGVDAELELCEPAERAEQPDMDTSVNSSIIVD